jgi:hypothetical protein
MGGSGLIVITVVVAFTIVAVPPNSGSWHAKLASLHRLYSAYVAILEKGNFTHLLLRRVLYAIELAP